MEIVKRHSFYQSCLGGEIKLLPVKDSPAAPQLPSEMHEKIMHGEIKFDNMMIMATDINDQRSQTGNAVSLFIHFTEEDELMRAFEALSTGGAITLAVAKQFLGCYLW
ncbi:MAG: VOC family protein [Bacteroidetes bacterium]|nr:VOC family protein [Bacteroidota bacterium]